MIKASSFLSLYSLYASCVKFSAEYTVTSAMEGRRPGTLSYIGCLDRGFAMVNSLHLKKSWFDPWREIGGEEYEGMGLLFRVNPITGQPHQRDNVIMRNISESDLKAECGNMSRFSSSELNLERCIIRYEDIGNYTAVTTFTHPPEWVMRRRKRLAKLN